MTKFIFTFCLFLLGMSLSAMAYDPCVPLGGHSPREIKNPLNGDVIATLRCCEGLNEVGNICKDTSLVDPDLTICHNQNQVSNCTDHKGCYVMGIDDMFVNDPEKHDALQKQMEENGGELKKNFSSCTRSAQCLSSFCKREDSGPKRFLAGRCEPQLVCRKASLNEPAPGSVECQEGLNRHPISTRCVSENTFPGLITDFKPKLVEGKQCQWEMNEEHMEIARQSFLVRSAMRFLLATSEVNPNRDCMHLNTYFKHVGMFMAAKESIALREYNKTWVQIEADKQVLAAAIADKNLPTHNPNKAVSFNGILTSYGALLKEIAVGTLALNLRVRDNANMGAYEEAQRTIGREVATKLDIVHKEISQMGPFDREWKVGGNKFNVLNPRCRSNFGFISNPFNFANSMYLYNRWSHLFKVKGTGKHNRDIFERDEGMIDALVSIAGVPTSISAGIPKELKKFWIFQEFVTPFPGAPNLPGFTDHLHTQYLIDPLTNISPYTFAPIFPFGQPFPRYFLEGGGHGDSYQDLYLAMGLKLNFFNFALLPNHAGFKPGDAFSVEPEIFKREDSDCFINENLPHCGKFNVLLKDMRDHMFASFLAYSISRSPNMSNLYNGQSWKRKLIRRWHVNFHNLDNYYTGMKEYRTKAEVCLNKVIADIETNLGNTDTTVTPGGSTPNNGTGGNGTSGNGTTPGTITAGMNYNGSGLGASAVTGSHQTNSSGSHVSYSTNGHISLAGMSSSMLGALNEGGQMTVLGNNTPGSDGTGILSAASSLASRKRLDEMKAANVAAKEAGVDVAAQELGIKESMNSLNSKYRNGAGGSGLGSNSARNGLGSSSAKNAENKDGVAGADSKSGKGSNGAGYGSGANGNNYGSNSSSYGSSASDSNSTNGKVDSTGLSAAEQQAILDSANRNKSELNANEYDSLFNIIHKAYGRNLNNVFGSEKDID